MGDVGDEVLAHGAQPGHGGDVPGQQQLLCIAIGNDAQVENFRLVPGGGKLDMCLAGLRLKKRAQLRGAEEARQLLPDVPFLKPQKRGAGGVKPDNASLSLQEDHSVR